MKKFEKISVLVLLVVLVTAFFLLSYFKQDIGTITLNSKVRSEQMVFDAVYEKDPENIIAVGKDFIGVRNKDKEYVLPQGYTEDMVFEMGDIVFTDEVVTPVYTVTREIPGEYVCYWLPDIITDATPTPTCTPVPTEVPVEKEMVANISGIGLEIYGTMKSRCTTTLLAYYKGEKVLVTNAHCATKAVRNPNDNVVPGYIESAGYWISPGTYDGGIYPDNSIGYTWYWFPNKIGTATMVTYDSAVIKLDSQNTIFEDEKLGEITSIYPSELAVGTKVVGHGATTGYTYGEVAATGVTIYMKVGSKPWTVPYANMTIIVGQKTGAKVSQGGDSGMAWRLQSNPSKGVTQNWGGNDSGTYSISAPLYVVFNGLHLSITP
jgi:hypothetical protein